MKRYVALGAVLTALGAAGTAAVQGAAAGGSAAQTKDGGLSVMPAVIEHNAQPGELATMKVANRSTAALDVTVTPRPWVQAVTGKVSPNRRGTLPGVSVSQTKFTLQPGAETDVVANLTSAPSAGYLYGAMEVVGVPTDAAKRKGVVLGYRLVGSIRINPAAPKYLDHRRQGQGLEGHRGDPDQERRQHGRRRLGLGQGQGRRGHEEPDVADVRILPGKTVNLPAGTKLAKGSYTATVALTAARQEGAVGDQEVQGEMRSSRVRFRSGGYARAVRLEPRPRSGWGAPIPTAPCWCESVVKTKILEGKQ